MWIYVVSMVSLNYNDQGTNFSITLTLSCNISYNIEEQHTITIYLHQKITAFTNPLNTNPENDTTIDHPC